MNAPSLPPPLEQWPAHMDAAQVALVTGCSERQVRNAERCGKLAASRITGAYGKKLWSKAQVMAWRGISHEQGDPFVDAKVA